MLELFDQLEFLEKVLAETEGADYFMAAAKTRKALLDKRDELLARLDEMEHAMEMGM